MSDYEIRLRLTWFWILALGVVLAMACRAHAAVPFGTGATQDLNYTSNLGVQVATLNSVAVYMDLQDANGQCRVWLGMQAGQAPQTASVQVGNYSNSACKIQPISGSLPTSPNLIATMVSPYAVPVNPGNHTLSNFSVYINGVLVAVVNSGNPSGPSAGNPNGLRKLTWTLTNGGTQPAWGGIFVYTSGGTATGVLLDPQEVAAGSSYAFEMYVSPNDTNLYAPGFVDFPTSISTYGGFPGSGSEYQINPDGSRTSLVTYDSGVVVQSGTTVGSPAGYANGATASSLDTPAPGDGFSQAGFTDGTNSSAITLPTKTATTVTAGTTTAGTATAGPGIGGASDAGIQDAANAINTNTTTVGNGIRAEIAADTNNLASNAHADALVQEQLLGNISSGVTAGQVAVAGAVNSMANATHSDLSGLTTAVNSVSSAVNAAATQAHTDAGGIKGDLDTMSGAFAGTSFNASTEMAAAQAAQAGAATYGGIAPSDGGLIVTVPGAPASAVGPGVTVGSTSIQFSFDPSSPIGSVFSSAATLMQASRGLLLVAVCIGFAASCSEVVGKYAASLPLVPGQPTVPGVEDLVPGVAQSKTWISAAGVVAAFMIGVAAIVGLVDTYLGHVGTGLGGILSSMDLTGLGSGLALADQYVPVGAIMTLGILRAIIGFAVVPVYLAAASVIRFLTI